MKTIGEENRDCKTKEGKVVVNHVTILASGSTLRTKHQPRTLTWYNKPAGSSS
jgi:hypothetical protein